MKLSQIFASLIIIIMIISLVLSYLPFFGFGSGGYRPVHQGAGVPVNGRARLNDAVGPADEQASLPGSGDVLLNSASGGPSKGKNLLFPDNVSSSGVINQRGN